MFSLPKRSKHAGASSTSASTKAQLVKSLPRCVRHTYSGARLLYVVERFEFGERLQDTSLDSTAVLLVARLPLRIWGAVVVLHSSLLHYSGTDFGHHENMHTPGHFKTNY